MDVESSRRSNRNHFIPVKVGDKIQMGFARKRNFGLNKSMGGNDIGMAAGAKSSLNGLKISTPKHNKLKLNSMSMHNGQLKEGHSQANLVLRDSRNKIPRPNYHIHKEINRTQLNQAKEKKPLEEQNPGV